MTLNGHTDEVICADFSHDDRVYRICELPRPEMGREQLWMERVVERIMAEPERAKELLVRQEPEWRRR